MIPARWVAWGVAVLVLVIALAVVTAKISGWRLDRAKGQVEVVTDDAGARRLEVGGERATAQAVDAQRDAIDKQRKDANELDLRARQDPDALQKLPPSVLARVRAGDCQLRGRTC